MKIWNATKEKTIAENAILAKNKFRRALGLLNKGEFDTYDAFILKPCSQVHTTGMKFNFDVLYINSDSRVIKTYENIKPNLVLPRIEDCDCVIELPKYSIRKFNISKDDIIELL